MGRVTSDLNLRGTRFPRSMLNSPANERLLRSLGVEIVEDCDAELADYARCWLRMVENTDWGKTSPATGMVRRALARQAARKAAA